MSRFNKVSSSDSEAFSHTERNALEDRPHVASIANDTADNASLFQMVMIQVHGEEEVLDIENRALAELRGETEWRRQANDVYRRTHLFYHLVYHLRLFLQDTYRWHEHVKLSAVSPVPTPYQQGGNDAICVVMELWTDDASRLGMVAAMGICTDIAPVLKGYRWPPRMSTQELYVRIGLADFCNSQQFRCHLSYDFVELPLLVPWRVFEGMRIDLQVVSYTCEYDSTRAFKFPQLLHHVQQGMSMWSGGTAYDGRDHFSMMQLHGGNTASTQREHHAGLETGRGPAALRNFQRACWLRTFWICQ